MMPGEEIARTELASTPTPTDRGHHAEQMLDAYSSVGMPLFYKHWSFGKHFAHHETFLPQRPDGARL